MVNACKILPRSSFEDYNIAIIPSRLRDFNLFFFLLKLNIQLNQTKFIDVLLDKTC